MVVTLSSQEISFHIKPDATFDEKATVAAVGEAFPGASVLRSPSAAPKPKPPYATSGTELNSEDTGTESNLKPDSEPNPES